LAKDVRYMKHLRTIGSESPIGVTYLLIRVLSGDVHLLRCTSTIQNIENLLTRCAHINNIKSLDNSSTIQDSFAYAGIILVDLVDSSSNSYYIVLDLSGNIINTINNSNYNDCDYNFEYLYCIDNVNKKVCAHDKESPKPVFCFDNSDLKLSSFDPFYLYIAHNPNLLIITTDSSILAFDISRISPKTLSSIRLVQNITSQLIKADREALAWTWDSTYSDTIMVISTKEQKLENFQFSDILTGYL
jgi:hypothetical protein